MRPRSFFSADCEKPGDQAGNQRDGCKLIGERERCASAGGHEGEGE